VITGNAVKVDAADFAGDAVGLVGALAPGGSVGDGVAVTDFCTVSCGVAGGFRSFTHASYSKNTETRKMIAANNLKLSMEDFFWLGHRVGSAGMPWVTT
jgi:hypothetical protein